MKTTTFTIGLVAALLVALSHDSAAAAPRTSPHSATFTHRPQAVPHRPSAVELRPEVTGVIPRAVRGGNLLQLLNPAAPPKYGSAEENVMQNPDDPGKWDGIKLLSISF